MSIKKLTIMASVLVVVALYLLLFNLSATRASDVELIDFNIDEFVDASTLSDTDRLVSSNGRFSLYLDETTSYFRVIDTENNHVWESNPSIPDPWELDVNQPITNSALNRQKSTLEIAYYNQTGSLTTINNYNTSIYHPQTILSPAGQRTFKVNYVENGFQILYEIIDLEIDYLHFPKFIDRDTFEAMEDYSMLAQLAYTGFNEELDAYEIVNYEGMTRLVRSRLYDVFYGKLDYTREQAIEENESFGYMEQFELFSFEVGVQVVLTEHGVKTSVIHDSIRETEDVRVGRVSLYPLFGTAVSTLDGEETEGYIVVPDGSGAVIEFNNGKVLQNSYRKRLYGNDYGLLPYRMPEAQQKIHIPLYGMVKEDAAYAAIITEGDAMAAINAEVAGRTDSYNKAYTTFHLRERESVTIGSGFNTYGIDLWTENIVRTDFTVDYRFLSNGDANYVGIANAYQNHLKETYNLTEKDTTRETVLTTEFIGAYDTRQFFLGVPYYSLDSLTTFEEAQYIIDELLARDLNALNVIYNGAINGGLDNELHTRANVERVLGGTRGYNALHAYLDTHDIPLYTSTHFMSTSGYNKLFDQYRYTASRIRGNHAMLFNYHYPTGLPYSETQYLHRGDDYIINPEYYHAIYDRFNKDFDFNHILVGDLGSLLAGHYDRSETVYLQDALRLQMSLLESMEQSLMLSSPLGYALPHASVITDLPTETTLFAIVDYQIPLLQLVLSGMVDYSSTSINLPSDRSDQYRFLKHLETGSNIKYTLSYDDSRNLINTDYNYYMSTHYVNWLDAMEDHVDELNTLGIHQGYLQNHERLAHNVYKATYSHGLQLVINYNLSDVTIDGITVPRMDYVVWEGN